MQPRRSPTRCARRVEQHPLAQLDSADPVAVMRDPCPLRRPSNAAIRAPATRPARRRNGSGVVGPKRHRGQSGPARPLKARHERAGRSEALAKKAEAAMVLAKMALARCHWPRCHCPDGATVRRTPRLQSAGHKPIWTRFLASPVQPLAHLIRSEICPTTPGDITGARLWPSLSTS